MHGSFRARLAASIALLTSILALPVRAFADGPAPAATQVARDARTAMTAHLVPWHIAAIVIATALTAALLRRFAPQRRRRVRATAILLAIYLGAAALGAGFDVVHWTDRTAQIWWFAQLLETLITINLTAIIFFDLALKAVRVEPASIVSDLVIGAAYVVAIISDMHKAGVNLSGIVATSAVVSGVLGLALAPTIGNILGGVALQLDSSISEGDWIQVDANTQGRVKAIRWRHTVVETRNWDTIIVPNVTLLQNNITILGKRSDQPHQRRYWVYFNVDFRHAPSDVIKVVTDALHSAPIPNVASDPKPNVVCMDFAREGRDSMGYYAVRYWLTNLAVDDPTNSAVRERIYAALKRAGIPLAMPATTVFVSSDDDAHNQAKTRREEQRRYDLLTTLPLFRDLTEEERSDLARSLIYAPFARDEVITQQGRQAHWLYILAKGEADVILADDDGTTRRVGGICGPDFFGERGVMTGETRSATVVAKTACDCYRLDRASFQRIVVARKEIAEAVTTVLLQRREELKIVQQNLDADQSRRQLEIARVKLLGQIQNFFGLN